MIEIYRFGDRKQSRTIYLLIRFKVSGLIWASRSPAAILFFITWFPHCNLSIVTSPHHKIPLITCPDPEAIILAAVPLYSSTFGANVVQYAAHCPSIISFFFFDDSKSFGDTSFAKFPSKTSPFFAFSETFCTEKLLQFSKITSNSFNKCSCPFDAIVNP